MNDRETARRLLQYDYSDRFLMFFSVRSVMYQYFKFCQDCFFTYPSPFRIHESSRHSTVYNCYWNLRLIIQKETNRNTVVHDSCCVFANTWYFEQWWATAHQTVAIQLFCWVEGHANLRMCSCVYLSYLEISYGRRAWKFSNHWLAEPYSAKFNLYVGLCVRECVDSEIPDWPHTRSVYKGRPVSASQKRKISENKVTGNSLFLESI
jgi:hypothetical protein